jgi:aconitase A
MPADSFGAAGTLAAGRDSYRIFRVNAVDGAARLPYCLKVLPENLLRNEDGRLVTTTQIQALAGWKPTAEPSAEIAFTPARVLLQDFHRSNLIGMGVLPLQFTSGENAASLGLTGEEVFSVRGLAGAQEVPRTVAVTATGSGGTREFTATVRIDTPAEAAYYRHGGILPYVLRHLAAR